MDWFVRAFLKASLVWFSLAVLIALAMALFPMLTVYRVAHLHIALLGFVTQMIYGVALHVIPRFVGQPLVHHRVAGRSGGHGTACGTLARRAACE